MTTHQEKVELVANRIFPGRNDAFPCGEQMCNSLCARLGKCNICEKSNDQLDYVLALRESNIFLKACPGSGKTEVVGLKAAYEFHGWQKRHSGIAILTFTNNARDVIRQRVQQYAGVENSGHPHFIGTVDSWLHRYLAHPFGHLVTGWQGRAYQSSTDRSVTLVDANENEGWINNYRCKTGQFKLDYHSQDKKNKPRSMPLYANMLQYDTEGNEWQIKIPRGNTFVTANEYFDSEAFSNFRAANSWYVLTREAMIKGFDNAKAHFLHDGFATYQDVEWICYRLLKEQEIVRDRLSQRFPFVVVDECQDLSSIQLEIFGLLRNSGSHLHFVGDLNQAIYEFKRVDAQIIEKFVGAAGFEVKELRDNFRSYQPIVDLCCKLVSSTSVRGKPVLDQKPLCVCFAYAGQDDLSDLPARFEQYLMRRGLDIKDSIILARGRTTVRRLQCLPDERPTNPVVKLATAIHLWADNDPRFRDDTLKYMGDFISAKFFKKRSSSQRYYCPESIDSLMRWRLYLARLLNACANNAHGISDLDQPMEDWAACVRTHFSQLVDSCLSTLDEAWSEDPVTQIKLDGNTFKAPAKSKGKRVADSLVVGASRTHKIGVTTIHSVKGKTFEAVLLVSLPTKSGGKGGHWEEWLQDQKSEPARFAFVASSRPSRLLAWAIPRSKNPKQDFEKITGLGFAAADLSEWKTAKKRKNLRSSDGQDRLF